MLDRLANPSYVIGFAFAAGKITIPEKIPQETPHLIRDSAGRINSIFSTNINLVISGQTQFQEWERVFLSSLGEQPLQTLSGKKTSVSSPTRTTLQTALQISQKLKANSCSQEDIAKALENRPFFLYIATLQAVQQCIHYLFDLRDHQEDPTLRSSYPQPVQTTKEKLQNLLKILPSPKRIEEEIERLKEELENPQTKGQDLSQTIRRRQLAQIKDEESRLQQRITELTKTIATFEKRRSLNESLERLLRASQQELANIYDALQRINSRLQ